MNPEQFGQFIVVEQQDRAIARDAATAQHRERRASLASNAEGGGTGKESDGMRLGHYKSSMGVNSIDWIHYPIFQ